MRHPCTLTALGALSYTAPYVDLGSPGGERLPELAKPRLDESDKTGIGRSMVRFTQRCSPRQSRIRIQTSSRVVGCGI